MVESFTIVFEKVCVLFLLLLIGYLCGKKQALNDEAVNCLNRIILNLVIPCTVISGFQSDKAGGLVGELLLCCGYSLIVLAVFFLFAWLVTKKLPEDERAVYVLSCSLTNCSFMGYPLQTAMIGPLGVFYGSGFVAVMNFYTFTLGYLLFTHDRRSISLKQLITRPAIWSVLLALALLLAKIRLPGIILTTTDYLASICVPVPMLIIGYHLSKVDLLTAIGNRKHRLYSAVRLLLFPLIALGILLLLGAKGDPLMATMIAASCPVATVVTILAGQISDCEHMAAELNAIQTLCSMLTIPLLVTLTAIVA